MPAILVVDQGHQPNGAQALPLRVGDTLLAVGAGEVSPGSGSLWSGGFANASVDSMHVYDVERLAPHLGCTALDVLPLPDSAFDIVTCQQGLQFFPDKIGALAEMRRVLRPGGRLGVAVWTRVEDQLFGYLRDAIANVISVETAERYIGPFLLTGEDAAENARHAGFENISLERVTLPAVLPGGARELFDTLPASGIASAIDALENAKRDELLAETVRLAGPASDGASLRGSLTASVLVLS